MGKKKSAREAASDRFSRRKRIKVARDDLAAAIGVRGTTLYRWEFGKSTASLDYSKLWERELRKRERAFRA